ncbi:hypothetical protein HMSSN036_86670 [Paenibacillus macerans]|nr:hypothetical protein HMSSN036_86670 [Paenibacillus macerans]
MEIENFDVDLLSARSLNITGVLSLKGVETSSLAVEADSWKDREFTTAHVVPGVRPEEEAGGLSFAEQEEIRFEPEVPKLTEWQAFPEEALKEKRSPDEPKPKPGPRAGADLPMVGGGKRRTACRAVDGQGIRPSGSRHTAANGV